MRVLQDPGKSGFLESLIKDLTVFPKGQKEIFLFKDVETICRVKTTELYGNLIQKVLPTIFKPTTIPKTDIENYKFNE